MQAQPVSNGLDTDHLMVMPTKAVLGAEVRCGDLRQLGNAAFQQLYQVFLDHLVIVVCGQRLSDSELVTFGRRLGELDEVPYAKTGKEKVRAIPEIVVVSNVLEDGQAIGVLRDAEVVWHSDNSYRETPMSFSALYALEVPASGGDTGFANMHLALETLPVDLRRRIETLTIKHDMTYNSAGDLRQGFKHVTDPRAAPGPSHPIVRTHPETGYNALYLGRRPNAYVNGLSLETSEQLLNTLWSHATQPQFSWHHQWRVGDIVIWDNRAVMHHRDPFDPGARRIMHRLSGKGDRPSFQKNAKQGPHPRSAA